MKCEKCGKEIPEGENKLCDDCKRKVINNIEKDGNLSDTNDVNKNKVKKEKKSGKKIKIFVIILVLITVIIVGSMFFVKKSTNTVGNTISNIRNYGYTAVQGSWIYYVAPSEDGKRVCIYKSKIDGSEKKYILQEDWDILGLNVKDDYIYFIAISYEPVESNSDTTNSEPVDTINNKIYRMKTDGTDLEVINNNAFHNQSYEMYVVDDSIYYIGVDQNIYSMKLDGSDVKRINEDHSGFLGITKDYIVYNVPKDGEEDENSNVESNDENNVENSVENEKTDDEEVEDTEFETFIMNRDGTDKHTVTGDRLNSINIVDNWIYYVDGSKHIYKVKIDGSENTLISDSVEAYNLNITNKYIYYLSYNDDSEQNVSLYRMNLDGTDNKEIYKLDNSSSYLNVVNDHAVFMDNNDDFGTINLVDSNGQNRVKLYELNLKDNTTTAEENTTGNESTANNANEQENNTNNTDEVKNEQTKTEDDSNKQ